MVQVHSQIFRQILNVNRTSLNSAYTDHTEPMNGDSDALDQKKPVMMTEWTVACQKGQNGLMKSIE